MSDATSRQLVRRGDLPDRAPVFMPGPLTVKAGELLCSEPWRPCWNPATHRRATPRGFILTCASCCDVDARPLEGHRER
jgi:hypothetical protein